MPCKSLPGQLPILPFLPHCASSRQSHFIKLFRLIVQVSRQKLNCRKNWLLWVQTFSRSSPTPSLEKNKLSRQTKTTWICCCTIYCVVCEVGKVASTDREIKTIGFIENRSLWLPRPLPPAQFAIWFGHFGSFWPDCGSVWFWFDLNWFSCISFYLSLSDTICMLSSLGEIGQCTRQNVA